MARVGFCMQDHQDFENKDKDKETEMRGGQTVRRQVLCWSMINYIAGSAVKPHNAVARELAMMLPSIFSPFTIPDAVQHVSPSRGVFGDPYSPQGGEIKLFETD